MRNCRLQWENVGKIHGASPVRRIRPATWTHRRRLSWKLIYIQGSPGDVSPKQPKRSTAEIINQFIDVESPSNSVCLVKEIQFELNQKDLSIFSFLYFIFFCFESMELNGVSTIRNSVWIQDDAKFSHSNRRDRTNPMLK